MPQRNVATNFTFEQQRQEINLLAADFWSQKGTVDTAASTYLRHDGSNAFSGQTLNVPNAFTINANSGSGTLTISGNLDVTGTTTTVSTANLEVTDKNILIAKGSTSDAQADGAGITIDSATDITFNFVDDNDALVSSIGLEATTFLKAPYGQFIGSGTPTGGQGVEINAPDTNTGQIISYDRANTAYKELRLKGSSVGIYGGTSNALVGSFSSTGLSVTGTITASDDVTITGNKTLKVESSSSGDYVRMYAGGGTGKWDIYGNGANLRFSDNESAGSVVFDRNVDANGGLDVTGNTSISGKLTIGTTTTNTSDAFTIMDPGNVFMSIRSDSIALGNYQILDFATGASNRASANMTGSIAAEIMGSTPLKSDLCFSTNKGDSITQSLKLRSSGTLESFVPSDATPNFKFRSDDVNWHGYLNQTVEGGSISTSLSCGGSWTVNGTTYDATKDLNGSFETNALVIHNQYDNGAGGFVFLNKAAGSTTTDGSVSELLRIFSGGNTSVGTGTAHVGARLTADGNIKMTQATSNTRRIFALPGTGAYSLNSSGGCAIAFKRDASNNDSIEFETHEQGASHASRMVIWPKGWVTTSYQFHIVVQRSTNQTGYNPSQGFGTGIVYNVVEEAQGTTSAALDTSNGRITVPVDGLYLLEASGYSDQAVFTQGWFIKNGSRMAFSDFMDNGGNSQTVNCVGVQKLSANDTIGYKAYGSGSTSTTIVSTSNHTWMKITLLG